jgi:hypothetical protein
VSITITVPADTKTPGSAGHTSDHDLMSDALTTLGASAANTAGDTFTGLLTASANVKVSNTSAPATPSGGAQLYANGGVARFVATDGNQYAEGRATKALTATATPGTTLGTITDGTISFSVPVIAAAYSFRCHFVYTPGGATGTPQFAVTSPAFSSGLATFMIQYNGIASGFARTSTASGFASTWNSAANTSLSGVAVLVIIEGSAVFTATGNLVVQASNASGSAIPISAGSRLEVFPLLWPSPSRPSMSPRTAAAPSPPRPAT